MRGGDGAASRVPGVLQCSRTNATYLGAQRDEAMSLARWRAPGWSSPPWIARRGRGRRRLASVVDVGIDLA